MNNHTVDNNFKVMKKVGEPFKRMDLKMVE